MSHFLLIGGKHNRHRILLFDTEEQSFKELKVKLNVGRFGHACSHMPDRHKVMIAGGVSGNDSTNSAEILDLRQMKIISTISLKEKRRHFGMGIVYIDGKLQLAAFGGKSGNHTYINSVEFFNSTTNQWQISSYKLRSRKAFFGSISVSTKSLCEK